MEKTYEYRIFDRESLNQETEKMLNKFGEQGWELVGYSSVAPVTPGGSLMSWHYFIFKREKK
jgi:hypothetical protein